jgi:hypothetical protein
VTGGALGYLDQGGGVTEVRFTLLGDTDLNGNVNVADLGNLATNFNSTAAGWINGDFDYNGNVNVADLGDLATNFNLTLASAGLSTGGGQTGAAPAAVVAGGAASAVPEPTGLALLGALAATSFHGRRRRRKA